MCVCVYILYVCIMDLEVRIPPFCASSSPFSAKRSCSRTPMMLSRGGRRYPSARGGAFSSGSIVGRYKPSDPSQRVRDMLSLYVTVTSVASQKRSLLLMTHSSAIFPDCHSNHCSCVLLPHYSTGNELDSFTLSHSITLSCCCSFV